MTEHDRGRPATASAGPQSRTGAKADHAVLRMQRDVGNAAVAHSLEQSGSRRPPTPVQRRGGDKGESSETGKALAEIHQLQDLRARKEKIEPGRVDEAKLNAVGASQHVVDKMSGSGGTEILTALTELQRNLKDIKDARYRGYQDALTFLALKQFDDDESAGAQRGFLLALAGNLLWALSGLIAITPVGIEARVTASLLSAFGKGSNVAPLVAKLMGVYANQRTRLAVAAGTTGAMLAQFANGLPDMGAPGSQVSTSLIDAKAQLDALNAALFADLDLVLYDLILVLLDGYQPSSKQNAAHTVAALMATTRSVAFAGYAEAGRISSDGSLDEAGITEDARNSLLTRWVANAGGIRGGHIAATTTTRGGNGNKAGAKLVTGAVDLLGGEQHLTLGPYDMVVPKIRQAARTFGVNIALDEASFVTTLRKTVGADKTLTIPTLGFDKSALEPAKLMWLNAAHALEWESQDTSGAVPPISGIDSLVIEPGDLTSMTINKQTVFSLDKITANCQVDWGGSENPNRYGTTTLTFQLDSNTDTSGRSPMGAP